MCRKFSWPHNTPWCAMPFKFLVGWLKVAICDIYSGHTSLSWIMRVQIALDSARGLEYVHEHTKPHYVHRDIKTSNILLDDAFRAKVWILFHWSFIYSCHLNRNPWTWFSLFNIDIRFWVGKTCWKNQWWRSFGNKSCWNFWLSGSRVSEYTDS